MTTTTAFQHSATAADSMAPSGAAPAPFSQGIDEDFFYPETQRAKCLHFLLHLVPYSHVLLLSGVAGSGKSCLLHQLQVRSNPSWRICHIDADDASDIDAVLRILADVFLFEMSADMDLDAKLCSLRKMLRAMRTSTLVPVLIFDGADRLSTPLLRFLDRLVMPEQSQESLLCIVLAGEPELEERLKEPALQLLRSHIGHSFELPPFNCEQTEAYIRHRLAIAGISVEDIFTPTDFVGIYRESGGLPGRINACAQTLLARHESPPAAVTVVQEGGSAGKPRSWRTMGLIVLCLLAVVMLLFQDRINAWFAVKPGTLQHKSALLPFSGAPEAGGKAVRGQGSAPVVADRQSSVRTATPDEQQGSAGVTPPIVAGQQEKAAVSPPPVVPAGQASGPAKAVGNEDFIVLDEPQTIVATEDTPGHDNGSAAPVSPAGGKNHVSSSVIGPEARNEDWILSRNPRHYTVQLVAMDRPRVMALTRQWQLQPPPAYFATRGALIAVLYGDYDSRQAAIEAGKKLGQRFSGIRPWARSFAAIQQKISARRVVTDKVPVVSRTAVDAGGLQDAPLVAREQWLLQRKRGHFTLQLMAMDLSAVTRRVKRWSIASRVAYYRTLKDDRELVAVTYGDYQTRQAAAADSRRLTRHIQGIKPWIRSFAAIQDAIHEFRLVRR